MKDQIDVRGVSTFFFFAIPAVLALAACWWLAFGQGVHYFRRALSQESRRAIYVGAAELPKNPIEIVVSDRKGAAVIVDRAEIDGDYLLVYYKNVTSSKIDFIKYAWRLLAPDGTVVASQEGYPSIYGGGIDTLRAHERAEMRLQIKPDSRAVKLDIRMEQ